MCLKREKSHCWCLPLGRMQSTHCVQNFLHGVCAGSSQKEVFGCDSRPETFLSWVEGSPWVCWLLQVLQLPPTGWTHSVRSAGNSIVRSGSIVGVPGTNQRVTQTLCQTETRSGVGCVIHSYLLQLRLRFSTPWSHWPVISKENRPTAVPKIY